MVKAEAERGVAERRACTAFDPPCYPGVVQWARTHRALREALVPIGWEASDAGNFSTVISPDQGTAITISTGNERTGKVGLPGPSTKYPKGPETIAAIEKNQQLSLLAPPVDKSEEPATIRRATWIFLIATDRGEVRSELSCPSEIGEDGKVCVWSERIIMLPLEFGETLPGDDEPPIPGIDVPVERL